MADRFDELFGAQPTGPSSSDRFEDLFGPGPETRPIEGFGYGKTPGFEEDLGRKELEDPEFARQVARTRKIDAAPVKKRTFTADEFASMTDEQRQKAVDVDTGDTAGELAGKWIENLPDRAKQWAGGLMQSVGQVGAQTAGGVAGTIAGPSFGRLVADALSQPLETLNQPIAETGRSISGGARQRMDANAPDFGDLGQNDPRRYAYDIANALVDMTAAVGVSAATRNPEAGVAVLSGQVFGQQYDDSIAQGRTPQQALQDASFMAFAESVGENKVIGDIIKPGGKSMLAHAGKSAASEGLQEMVTQTLQTGYSAGVLNEKMTFGEAVRQVVDAGIIGAGAGGGVAVGAQAFHRQPDILSGEQSGAPTGPGIRESGALNVDITPEDEASPLPTELIAGGKMEMGAATATTDANRVLGAAGMPNVGTRVSVVHNGKAKSGAVADAYEVTVGGQTSPGVKIKLDDGTVIDEPVATLKDLGVVVTPLPNLPEGDLADPVVQQFAAIGAANVAEAGQTGQGGTLSGNVPADRRMQPSDANRTAIHSAVRTIESNNNPHAVNPESGATGAMQTMRATLKDPGFGVRPAQNDSPAEQERVGHDYLDAMLNRYGQNIDKALAAYNWGPGHVDDAVRKHGDQWKSQLPDETVDYLKRAHGILDGGAGVSPETSTESANVNRSAESQPERAPQAAEQPDLFGGPTRTASELDAQRSAPELLQTAQESDRVDDLNDAIDYVLNRAPNSSAPGDTAQSFKEFRDAVGRPDLSNREVHDLARELARLQGIKVPEAKQADSEYVPFPEDSGTLGIPRAEMPQIKAEHRGAMVNYLNARGIQHEEATVPAAELLATQKEYSPAKVQQAHEFTGGDRAVLVSQDGYIVDGHHQALAAAEKGERIRAIRLKAPIHEVLDTLKGMPSATTEAVASGLQDQVNAAGFGDKVEVISVTGKQKADSGFHRSFLGGQGIDPKSGRQDTPEGARARFEAGYDHFFEVHGKKLQVKAKGGKFVATYEHSEYQPTEFDTREQAVEWLLDRAVYPNQVMEALGRREPVKPNERSDDLPPPLSKQDAMKAKMQEKKRAEKGATRLAKYGPAAENPITGYDGDPNDERGLKGSSKERFIADAKKYLTAVGDLLTEAGFAPGTDRKGRKQKAVSVNEGGPAVSGDVTLSMFLPEGNGVYVDISQSAISGADGISIMYRGAQRTKDPTGSRHTNIWQKPDISAQELADKLVKLAKEVEPDQAVTAPAPGTDNASIRPDEKAEPPKQAAMKAKMQGKGSKAAKEAEREAERIRAEEQSARIRAENEASDKAKIAEWAGTDFTQPGAPLPDWNDRRVVLAKWTVGEPDYGRQRKPGESFDSGDVEGELKAMLENEGLAATWSQSIVYRLEPTDKGWTVYVNHDMSRPNAHTFFVGQGLTREQAIERIFAEPEEVFHIGVSDGRQKAFDLRIVKDPEGRFYYRSDYNSQNGGGSGPSKGDWYYEDRFDTLEAAKADAIDAMWNRWRRIAERAEDSGDNKKDLTTWKKVQAVLLQHMPDGKRDPALDKADLQRELDRDIGSLSWQLFGNHQTPLPRNALNIDFESMPWRNAWEVGEKPAKPSWMTYADPPTAAGYQRAARRTYDRFVKQFGEEPKLPEKLEKPKPEPTDKQPVQSWFDYVNDPEHKDAIPLRASDMRGETTPTAPKSEEAPADDGTFDAAPEMVQVFYGIWSTKAEADADADRARKNLQPNESVFVEQQPNGWAVYIEKPKADPAKTVKMPQSASTIEGGIRDAAPGPRNARSMLVRFASGMSRIGDLKAGTRALGGSDKMGVGVDVGELSANGVQEIAAAVVNWGGRVFVDSGAFSLFKKSLREQDNVNPLDFDQILRRYDSIIENVAELDEAEAVPELGEPHLLFVMPDIVGDQAGSLALVDRYATWISTQARSDVIKPIVPLQLGDLSLAEAYRQVVERLGTKDFIVGIPSNEKAVSHIEFAGFVAEVKPTRIHFLGAAHERTLGAKLDQLQQVIHANPGYRLDHLSADANILRSALYGRDSDLGDATRAEKVQGTLEARDLAAGSVNARYHEGYGSKNKLVTRDRAEQIREKLRAKLRNQVNSGIDPEVLAMGTELAVFHIEAGARKFADFAKALSEDLGMSMGQLKRYLRGWYLGAQAMIEDHGEDVSDMDGPGAVRAALSMIEDSGIGETDADSRNPDGSAPRAESPGVQPAQPDERARRLDEGSSGGSQQDLRSADREGGQAAERSGEGPGAQSERGGAGTGRSDGRPADRNTGPSNYVIREGALEEERGLKQKGRDNVEAIRIVKQLEREQRNATPEEQDKLARYVGWGGMKNVFPDGDGAFGKGFEDIGRELEQLLTPDEYATARRSIQYAHYTGEKIVREMWRAVERMGFEQGVVFEPGMGTGNFPGMMPEEIRNRRGTHYVGLEFDGITAAIAKALYPRYGVTQGDYTQTEAGKDAYTLAIGNPPFSETVIKADPAYRNLGLVIHDYFFAKTLDAVKPGGLLAFVTSAGTMNKLDRTAREYLAERAWLAGAIRLPGDAFKENANTQVTTDIIFLRKKVPGEARPDWAAPDHWVETSIVNLPTKDGRDMEGHVSRYFVENPEMVLGEAGFFDKLMPNRYGVRRYTVRGKGDFAALLTEAVNKLPEDILQRGAAVADAVSATADFNVEEAKNGSFYLKDGELYQKQGGIGRKVETKGKGSKTGLADKDQEKVRDLVPIRDHLRAVYAADLAIAQGRAEPGSAEAARKVLNTAYDAFTKKHGPINKAVFTRRRPNRVQIESARRRAREEARAQGHEWDDGTFDPSELYDNGSSVAEVARVRAEMKEAYAASGQAWSDGTFSDDEVPDTVIEKRPNIDPFKEDPESYRLRSIEHYDDETETAKKSRVFFESVIAREEEPDIKNATDALYHVLNQAGRVDLDQIAKLAGTSPGDAATELVGQIFLDPETGQWEHSVRYLSGNVRHKLAMAQAKAAEDKRFQVNADALQGVMPPELGKNDVAARLGMAWIPSSDVQAFGESLGLSPFNVTYEPRSAIWAVSGDRHSAAATSTWGTDRRSAVELIRDGLSGATPKIFDTWRDENGEHRVLNQEATQAATDKLAAIKEKFQEWIYSDQARTDRLLTLYNERFNSHVAPEYDGSYLTTPGVTAEWSWRPHQKRAIARVVQDGNMYLAHAVGAGKTASMIASAMEMRRLGLVSKPMIAVPNHMLGQFTKEFYELYPLAKLMVADEEAFHTDRRKQFVSDVALNDLDSVVITHSAFGLIPMSQEFEKRFIQDQLDDLRDILSSVDKDERQTRRKIEQQIEQTEQRLRGVTTRRRDQTFTFEEMGVDFMFVDEAHLFRKLDFATRMGEIKGIDPVGSMRSMDLFIKSRYLESRRPGRSLVLASGTPITNTMAELFTVSRYLQPGGLAERGIDQFDAWANAFGDTVTDLEPTAGGTYKPQTRFAQFVNTPELSVMVRQVMDVVTSTQLEQYVVRPKVHRELLNIPQTPGQKTYQALLAARMTAIENRRGKPQKGDDIILTVIGDGRKSAIDMRLVEPDHDRESTKLEALIDNVFKTWKETKDHPFYGIANGGYTAEPVAHGPATQMVFSSLGVSEAMAFNVHRYIRGELIKRGVPAAEIVLFNQVKSTVAKQKVFNDMNAGKVRILVGSADKMATGVNAQKRLYANHNLDPEWLPSTDEQRNGRIIRQGNTNREIRIFDYATKGTYDSQMWGIMARKAKFIEGFFRGDPTLRTIEDLGEASTYEQAKALTTKDPRILELTEARQELEKEIRRRSAHESEQATLSYRARQAKAHADTAEAAIVLHRKDAEQVEDIKGDTFKATLQGKQYDDRGEFQEALDALREGDTLKRGVNRVGKIGGFDLGLMVSEAERLTFGKDGTAEKTLHVSPILILNRDEDGEARFTEVSPTNTAVSVQAALVKIAAKPADTQAYIERKRQEQREFEERAKEVTDYPGEPKILELTATVQRIEAELKADHDREQAAKQAPQQQPEPKGEAAPQRTTIEIDLADVDRIRAGLLRRMAELGITDRVAIEAAKGLRLARNDTQAQYDYQRRLISIALERSRNPQHSLDHEAIHALKHLGVITPPEWEALVDAAWADDRLRTWAQTSPAYRDLSLEDQKEEAAAEFFADTIDMMRGRAIEGQRLKGWQGVIARAAVRVLLFLNTMRHAASYLLTGKPGRLTHVDVVVRIDKGIVGRREPMVRGRPIKVTFGKKAQADEVAPRSHGLPKEAGTPLSAFGNAKHVETQLKAHPRYKEAKGGSDEAAIELVRDLVPREMLLKAREQWAGATFVPVLAEEASGDNKIPIALASRLAWAAGGHVEGDIIQTNHAFHTGAKAMDRLVSRPAFAGSVERGTRYVIVDDVTVLGGTLAELANHIAANGGEVVGSALLVNASRNPVLGPDKLRSKAVERRFGNVIREELGIEPAALTGPESFYLLGFKDADSLRARIAKAKVENVDRADRRGFREGPAPAVSGAALADHIDALDRLEGDPDLEPETIEDNGDAEEPGALSHEDRLQSAERRDDFFNRYLQHIDIRGRDGTAQQTLETVRAEGWKSKGFGVNLLPVWAGGEPHNIMEERFLPRAGDVVYLVPPEGREEGGNGAKIKAGWKPGPGEAVIVEQDGQDLYELYSRAQASPRFQADSPPPLGTFPDAIEKEWQDATKGIGDGSGWVQRFKLGLGHVGQMFARHYRFLAHNDPRWADLMQQLRKLEAAPGAAKERAVRTLKQIVDGFSRADLDLFTRAVVTDDLAWEVEQEHDLPFGFTPESLDEARRDIATALEQNQKVKEAVRKRKALNRQIAGELVDAGVLEAERLKNPAYYRHVVLDYARAEAAAARVPGRKKKLRSPIWAKRLGSSKNINANYLEAEFDWLAKALVDIPTARAITWVKESEHNILPELRAQAKANNKARLDAMIQHEKDTLGVGDGPLQEMEKGFRQRIAMGFKFVEDAIDTTHLDVPPQLQESMDAIGGGGTGDPFPFLSWLLDNNQPGANGAAVILKAISQRRIWEQQVLGRHYVDPFDADDLVAKLAPEGYAAWSPDEGKLLFTVKTLPEHAIDEMLRKVDSAPGVTADDLRIMLEQTRKALAFGGMRYAMILPTDVAATLNELRRDDFHGLIDVLMEVPLRAWKRWVLINPRRFFKYNFNNQTGDLDAIIATRGVFNVRFWKNVGRAGVELARVMSGRGEPSYRYEEAVERGVFDSGLSIQEIPDINRLSAFEGLTQGVSLRPDRVMRKVLAKVWQGLQSTTQWRENVFRYAAYLDYVERIEAGQSMARIGYGASLPKMVDAVQDPRDRAALLARDALGDYGAISEAGNQIRRKLIPFWSWSEINTKRYWRLSMNVIHALKQGAYRQAGMSALNSATSAVFRTGMLTVRMGLYFALINMFNHLFHDDEEEELSDEQKRQLHIILGRDSEGRVITLRAQGAFSDAMSWFGFGDAAHAYENWELGRGPWYDILFAAPKATVNKLVTGVSPLLSQPYEAISGTKLFPDIFATRFIRDRWRNFMSTFSLENEYDLMLDKPSRGYGRSWLDTLVYVRDPGEIAYNEARGLAYDWLKREKGQDGGTFRSDRADALYEWRAARKFEDKEAEQKALQRLIELGVDDKDLNASIKRAHPLGPIAKKDRKRFLDSLTDEELTTFERAETWYRQRFLGEEA